MRKVKIYLKYSCPFCIGAMTLLKKHNVEFEEIDVAGKQDVRRWLSEATGQNTVPQIFFDDESIGGYTELATLERRGQLLSKLEA